MLDRTRASRLLTRPLPLELDITFVLCEGRVPGNVIMVRQLLVKHCMRIAIQLKPLVPAILMALIGIEESRNATEGKNVSTYSCLRTLPFPPQRICC